MTPVAKVIKSHFRYGKGGVLVFLPNDDKEHHGRIDHKDIIAEAEAEEIAEFLRATVPETVLHYLRFKIRNGY